MSAPRCTEPLRDCVKTSVEDYLLRLDGDGGEISGLYDLVMAEVMRPLLESVLAYAAGNQSRAADMLGIHRTTLRKKLSADSRTARLEVRYSNGPVPLRDCARTSADSYLGHLEGHDISGLYELATTEVETPLFESVLAYAGGNQSQAADMLGINRATLRKKLRHYRLL